ncbi:UNVERIFIED_CONTAM: hypothetical protein GTU68_003322 [Idotea baltica]|nr:hypothetical protein [Idotea baltica]
MVHEAAATGYQRQSEAYQQARPSYHPLVLSAVVAAIGAGPVIDLGAGTGISTAALVDLGLDVTAVEPVQAMRAALAKNAPGATVLDGTAEEIPVAENQAAAVVVAQAFHWFDHALALDEIVRVLEPQGYFVTLWNVRDESVPWMAAYTAIQDRVQGDTPRYRDMTWRTSIEADQRFELVSEVRQLNPHASNADQTVARFLSTSFIASLAPERQQELADEVRRLVVELGPEYDFPYWTEAQIWRLQPIS